MIIADRQDDRIVFIGSPRYKELIKAIPGARYNTASKGWRAPLSWATCLSARGVLGQLLTVGPELAAWSWNEHERIQQVLGTKIGRQIDGFEPTLPPNLRPFQVVGSTFLLDAERCILADEMGLGKTVEVIAALPTALSNGCGQALVVCTNTMKFTWAAEIAKWAPDLDMQVIHGTAGQRRKQFELAQGADVVIINWAALRSHSRLAPYGSTRLTDAEKKPGELQDFDFSVVVFDEAHKMKDPKAKQTRAAWQVASGARYRWALTGTPIANSPADLWSIGHCIAPEEYPSRNSYIDRYTLSGMNVWGGLEVYGLDPKNSAELFGFLDPRFLRRTKAEVLTELPAKIYSVRRVSMEPKQAKAYDQFAKTMLAELDSGILFSTNPLAKLGRLTQLAAATPALSAAGDVESLDSPSCKIDALMDLLDEGDGPLVVFAASRKLIELAAKKLTAAKVSHVLITGLVPAAERTANVGQFQAGKAQVCLATLGAGGEGITLTAASRVVFLQRSWSMVENIQAEDRIHRLGQTAETVEVIDIVTADTVEDAVLETGAWKSELLQEVVRDPGWLRRSLQK